MRSSNQIDVTAIQQLENDLNTLFNTLKYTSPFKIIKFKPTTEKIDDDYDDGYNDPWSDNSPIFRINKDKRGPIKNYQDKQEQHKWACYYILHHMNGTSIEEEKVEVRFNTIKPFKFSQDEAIREQQLLFLLSQNKNSYLNDFLSKIIKQSRNILRKICHHSVFFLDAMTSSNSMPIITDIYKWTGILLVNISDNRAYTGNYAPSDKDKIEWQQGCESVDKDELNAILPQLRKKISDAGRQALELESNAARQALELESKFQLKFQLEKDKPLVDALTSLFTTYANSRRQGFFTLFLNTKLTNKKLAEIVDPLLNKLKAKAPIDLEKLHKELDGYLTLNTNLSLDFGKRHGNLQKISQTRSFTDKWIGDSQLANVLKQAITLVEKRMEQEKAPQNTAIRDRVATI